MIFVGAPVNFIQNGRAIRATQAISTLSFAAGRNELVALGRRVGLGAGALRARYTAFEHLSLINSKIDRALQSGAIEVDWHRVIDMANAKIRGIS